MTTVVNTPSSGGNGSGAGMGVMVGVLVVVVALVVLFLIFGWPKLRGGYSAPDDVNINLPDKVNIDLNEAPAAQP